MKNLTSLAVLLALTACGSEKDNGSPFEALHERDGIYTIISEQTSGNCDYDGVEGTIVIKAGVISGTVGDYEASGVMFHSDAAFSVDVGNREYVHVQASFTPMMEGTWESELYDCSGTITELYFQKFEM